MLKWIHRLLFGKIDDAINTAQYVRAVERDKQRGAIMEINRRFKILLEEGSIELVIKNVKGVIENELD